MEDLHFLPELDYAQLILKLYELYEKDRKLKKVLCFHYKNRDELSNINLTYRIMHLTIEPTRWWVVEHNKVLETNVYHPKAFQADSYESALDYSYYCLLTKWDREWRIPWPQLRGCIGQQFSLSIWFCLALLPPYKIVT